MYVVHICILRISIQMFKYKSIFKVFNKFELYDETYDQLVQSDPQMNSQEVNLYQNSCYRSSV